MHILHIISTLDPAAGGPAEGVRLLLSQTEDGCTGEAVTLDAPDAPWLRTLPFPAHGIGPIHSVYGFHRNLLPWLRANRNRFDGFLLNGMWQYCGLATMLAAAQAVPYVVFAHGMLDPYFKRRYPLKHLKKLPYWYLVESWVLRRAFRVLFTTETEQRLAKQSFAVSSWTSAIVPYGVQVPHTPRESLIQAFYELVPDLQGRRFLLFLGRIDRKKGCDLLVEAFAGISAESPDLHLVMAGPDRDGWAGELRATAASMGCADRIHWPGIVQGSAKWGAFHAAEVFILPSHQENFGIAVAEAMACGRPVLLSTEVNLAQTIEHDGCALIEPDTLDGTRNLLKRWAALTLAERETMGTRALESYRRRFDLRESVRAIQRLFQQALDSGRYTAGRKH